MRIIYLLLLFSLNFYGQNQFPKDYFIPPLDIPMQLSGNFGELRPNHFHAGFDFKTQQKEGLNVYASAEGYVSRIKISTGGYGKAVYITHPNGYTTLYGHLQRGVGEIEKFIKKQQYLLQSYEIEVMLKPNDLPVKKGQIIGLSGNTGGSEGPHLHFEIRDTQTEKVINPLFFGFDKELRDSKRPMVNALFVYPVGENSIVNQTKKPIAVNLSLQNDGSYLAEKVLATGKIGFGVTTVDADDVSWNYNGIYKIESFLNGKSYFSFQFDSFSFDETRYINALIDYNRYKKLGQRVQKLFMLNPYSLSLIKTESENGLLTVVPNITQSYRIEISDFNGNVTKICVPIQYSPLAAKETDVIMPSKYIVRHKKDCSFVLDNVSVFFPANTFYEDFNLNFDVKNGTLFLHEDIVPAHSNFTVTIESQNIPETEKEKMFIANINNKKINFNNTKRKGDAYTVYTKYLGQYRLMKDSIPPIITIKKGIEGKWISDQKNIQLTVSDDLSGIKTYNGFLNGKWILLEYESKLKRLTHDFADGIVAEGKNELKVVVSDNVGNSTIFETHFFRSQKP